MKDQTRKFKDACALFNLKVDRLNQLSFTEHVKTVKTGITISSKRDDEGNFTSGIERRGRSQESVEAFILTFRLFLQDNEPISIRRLSEHYSAGVVSPELEKEFAEIRSVLNRYLNDVHEFRLKENEKILTRREMLEMYL